MGSIQMKSSKLLKISNSCLNLENTLVNGQCFNWYKMSENKYKGIFRNYLIVMERSSDSTISLRSQPQMTQEFIDNVFLKEYLQIPDVDLEKHYDDWTKRDPKYFAPISERLEGCRCLRQDPWECTISFICSSNNNIKRIGQLVEKLRVNYGSEMVIDDRFRKDEGIEKES